MDDEIDLRDIIKLLWGGRYLIVGVFLAAVLVAGAISFAMPPVYKVSSIIALGNFNDPIYTSQISAKEIMTSDEFILDVVDNLSFTVPSGEFRALRDSIDVIQVKDTENLIQVSIETNDRQKGIMIIGEMIRLYRQRSESSYNRSIKILSDQMASSREQLDVLGNDINQTREVLKSMQSNSVRSESSQSIAENDIRISRTLDYLNAQESRRSALLDSYLSLQKEMELSRHLDIIQPAKEPVYPVKPRKVLNIVIAAMLGLIIGTLAAFLRVYVGTNSCSKHNIY